MLSDKMKGVLKNILVCVHFLLKLAIVTFKFKFYKLINALSCSYSYFDRLKFLSNCMPKLSSGVSESCFTKMLHPYVGMDFTCYGAADAVEVRDARISFIHGHEEVLHRRVVVVDERQGGRCSRYEGCHEQQCACARESVRHLQ